MEEKKTNTNKYAASDITSGIYLLKVKKRNTKKDTRKLL